MHQRWLLYIVFLFQVIITYGQQSYAKVILNETYNVYSSNKIISCEDTSSSVYSFIPIVGSSFYAQSLIALKHDSLGNLFSKQFIEFPNTITVKSCFWHHNKVFVVLTTNPHLGSGDPNARVAILKFSHNLILENTQLFYDPARETNLPNRLVAGPDSTLLLTGSLYQLNNPPGSQFLAQLDYDLNLINYKELEKQWSYSVPGYSNGQFFWYTEEGRYTLNQNFNTVAVDSLVSSSNTRPRVTKFQTWRNGIRLKIFESIAGQSHTSIVKFNTSHIQDTILLRAGANIRNINENNLNTQYHFSYLNENDSLKIDLFTIHEDSGYTLKQTISLNDTLNLGSKPHQIGLNHFFVQHVNSIDTSINFYKGVDSIPSASCLSVSYPPDTIIDTNNVVYSFQPFTQAPPQLINGNQLLQSYYPLRTIDSLSVTGDTTLPAFEFRCTNKACPVFTPLNGGLLCNQSQLLLRARPLNPFNIDSADLQTIFTWNQTLVQDTFLVRGFNAQTITLTGENFFCRQTQNINVDFDSVRVRSRYRGDICLDNPQLSEIFVDGYFDRIQWQNPNFDDTTYQRVYLPGSYNFQVESPKGCRLNSTALVPEKCPPKVYIPNAFTPNGDGTNDTFIGYADFTDEFIFRVYDRWGKVIFTTSTSPIVWDGKYNGVPVQVGVYNWRLVYNAMFDNRLFIKDLMGHITVVR